MIEMGSLVGFRFVTQVTSRGTVISNIRKCTYTAWNAHTKKTLPQVNSASAICHYQKRNFRFVSNVRTNSFSLYTYIKQERQC